MHVRPGQRIVLIAPQDGMNIEGFAGAERADGFLRLGFERAEQLLVELNLSTANFD